MSKTKKKPAKKTRVASVKLRMKSPKTATISSTTMKGADLKMVITERRPGDGDQWNENAKVKYTVDGLPVNVEAYMAVVFTMILGADAEEG